MVCIGVALAALVLIALFSMLDMAHRQEEDQDRLEFELTQNRSFLGHLDLENDLIRSEAGFSKSHQSHSL
jgi:hypothetical protein